MRCENRRMWWNFGVMGIFLMGVLLGSLAVSAFAEAPKDYKGTISIGGQPWNESNILANMAKLLVEAHTGLKVNFNPDFAGVAVLHEAMRSNQIDIYPCWTGSHLIGLLRYEGPTLGRDEAYALVKSEFEKRYDMSWAKPLGFNNTYAMAVRREIAEKNDLKKASDLAAFAKQWRLGGDSNFDTRHDAYPGWSKHYGISFKEVLPMEYALMYKAIEAGEVDVIAAYSTDSRIKKLNLVILEDDKGFFPDYSACFVINRKTFAKYPQLLDIIEKVSGRIDEATMTELNYQFDEGMEAEKVARDFLEKEGLL